MKLVSGFNVTCEPSGRRVRRVWELIGIPVMGSSFPFSWRIVQEGFMRRSAETIGGWFGWSDGTIIWTFMSGAVW